MSFFIAFVVAPIMLAWAVGFVMGRFRYRIKVYRKNNEDLRAV